jgi:hypothetical protein
VTGRASRFSPVAAAWLARLGWVSEPGHDLGASEEAVDGAGEVDCGATAAVARGVCAFARFAGAVTIIVESRSEWKRAGFLWC